MNKIKFIFLGALIMGLLFALSGFTGIGASLAQQMKPLLVQIINTPNQAVPVTMQGTGSISGQVTVNNTNSIPVEVKNQVQTVPGNAALSVQEAFSLGATGNDPIGLRRDITPIHASLIVVSPDPGDELEIWFREGEVKWLQVGRGNGLEDVIVIPLPQKIPVDNLVVFCANELEDCQVNITIIGE